jgi:hypothetical protein
VIRAHVAAVRALLAPLEASPTSMPVFVAGLDDPHVPLDPQQPSRTPYVVLRTDGLPTLRSERLAPWSNDVTGRLYVVCAGSSWDEAAWALEKTRGVLADVVPVVAGRSVAPLRLVDSSDIEADRDVSPPLWSGVDVYALQTF